jgi:alkylated DNA nucleotide flippase Atl1
MFGHSMHRFREKKQIPCRRVVQAATESSIVGAEEARIPKEEADEEDHFVVKAWRPDSAIARSVANLAAPRLPFP